MRFAHGLCGPRCLPAGVVERAAVNYATMPRFERRLAAHRTVGHTECWRRPLSTVRVDSTQTPACHKRPYYCLSAVCCLPSAICCPPAPPTCSAGLASGAIGAEAAVASRSRRASAGGTLCSIVRQHEAADGPFGRRGRGDYQILSARTE